MGNIKDASKVNINEIQTGYIVSVAPSPAIELVYTQANVTNKNMGIITATTIEVVKNKILSAKELPHGLLLSNAGGTMLIPYTNIRNIVYK